ncbi:hypothetical protein MTO96_008164 [Rhipicephalus appendiculatus]
MAPWTRMRGKEGLLDDSYEEQRKRRYNRSITLFFCLLVLLPVVLCSIYLAVLLLSKLPEDRSTEMVDRVDELQVPTFSMPRVGRTPSTDDHGPGPSDVPASAPKIPSRHHFPHRRFGDVECESLICRFVSQWLRSIISPSVDPCTDFYRYVCGSFRGMSQLSHLSKDTKVANIKFLAQTPVPPLNQLAAQKVAGLYQLCVAFVTSQVSETSLLAEWMISLNLDLSDEKNLARVDPVDMIVRCSLDLGVPAILYFELHKILFFNNKRAMKVSFSDEEDRWLKERRPLPNTVNTDYYSTLLSWYGLRRPSDTELASKLVGYEIELQKAKTRTIHQNAPGIFVAVLHFSTYTKPYVSTEKWVRYITTYTNNTYRRDSSIILQQNVLDCLTDLFKARPVGEMGLRYLVAWSVYKQLVNYTVPGLLLSNDAPSDACYEHVREAMPFAITSTYYHTVIGPFELAGVRRMVSDIRNAFRLTFESSSWVTGEDRNISIQKLDKLRAFVGSPGRYLEVSFVEDLYRPLPDVPRHRLFDSWIKALSLSTHQKWADQTTFIYDDTVVGAFYQLDQNALIIPTASIQRPLYFHDAPAALNYGSLGVIAGHELMHAYDVRGIEFDDMRTVRPWPSRKYREEYTKRTLCLRASHRAALRRRPRQAQIDDFIDSENLADFAGVRASYKAYSSLPYNQRSLTLPSLNISADRLFFIGHCIKTCAQYSQLAAQYAPFRSRCIVPLMNMPEFSTVCCLFLAIFLQYATSTEHTTSSAATMPRLHVRPVLASDMVRTPSTEHGPMPTPASRGTLSPSHYIKPSRGSNQNVCTNPWCRLTTQWLRTKIDFNKDPCKDFYSYVCRTHKGPSELIQIAETLREDNMKFLMELKVPSKYQRSWEKAAGMFQACIAFANSDRAEIPDLVAWMTSMDLDLNDEERLSKVASLDMIVRCSLDLGVPAILSFELQKEAFFEEKRVIKLDFSQKEKEWLSERLQRPDSVNTNDYAELLTWYGVQPSRDTELATNLVAYEKELESILKNHPETEPRFVSIDSIPVKFTTPYNAEDQWVTAFSKYTNNIYQRVDPLLCQEAALNVLVDVLNSESLGEKGLRYLIAWSIYTQLVQYTVPALLLDKKTAAEACYEHTDKAMHLALTSPYLQKVTPAILKAVKAMVFDIRSTFRAILDSSFATGNDRSILLKKLDNMKTYVGSPGRRLEPYFVEDLYSHYPDVPPDRLFPTWIKALGLSSHYLWSDQITRLYDETEVDAHYETNLNTLIVPTAIISRPLYNYRIPEALNYGALGGIVGHEMMHAYDAEGIDYNENAQKWHWRSAAFSREYTKRTLCLRRSYRAAARQKARQGFDDVIDSENLVDFVGVRIAYKAFAALPERKRTQTLVGTNISSEGLFFVGHCVKWCAEENTLEPIYAPFRSRCMVPLMNMKEFSDAFGCAAGDDMNPTEKCDFWQ